MCLGPVVGHGPLVENNTGPMCLCQADILIIVQFIIIIQSSAIFVLDHKTFGFIFA